MFILSARMEVRYITQAIQRLAWWSYDPADQTERTHQYRKDYASRSHERLTGQRWKAMSDLRNGKDEVVGLGYFYCRQVELISGTKINLSRNVCTIFRGEARKRIAYSQAKLVGLKK